VADNLTDTPVANANQSDTRAFIGSVLDSSTRYAVVACSSDGLILLWNEGARRAYGHEPDEILGRANWESLFASRAVLAGQPREIIDATWAVGIWEGHIAQVRKSGERFMAEVAVTPWLDSSGQTIGFLMVARELSRPVDSVRPSLPFDNFVDCAPDAVAVISSDGRIVSVNSRTQDLFGYTRHELIGQPVEMLVPECLRDYHFTHRFGHSKQPDSGPFGAEIPQTGLRKDGSEFPAEISLGPLETEQGTFTVGFIRDISDRKRQQDREQLRVEEALQVSEERFRSAFEHTNVAMVLTDLKHRFVRVNAAAARLFGYTPEEMLSLSMGDITHPDDLVESYSQRETLLDGTSTFFQIEKRYRHKSGHILWGLTNVSLIRDAAGQPSLYFGQVQDIGERKRAEEALRKAQNRLQYLVSSSPAVLFTCVVEGERARLTWVSNNIHDMMGYSVEQALQPEWWQKNLHHDDLQMVMAQVRGDLLVHDRAASEFRFRHRDGRYRWVRNELRLLRDFDGVPVETVGSWSDLTERKHLEDQFRQSQKMEAVGRLAGGIAHDFNNLLTVINGYSELLVANSHAGDPFREFAEQIHKAGQRATSLTRQLLTFSRRQVISPVAVDLNSLLSEMEKMLARLIGEDIEMKIVGEPELWKVKVDPSQMEQVVMNLVINARDAMPQGGKLTIETSNVEVDQSGSIHHPDTRPGHYVRLAVSDSGCGMDDATKSRIFEPFFTTKGPEKGSGLGLATVYGIVKQSDGRIDVYSEPGIGTTFKIHLPRDAQAGVPSKLPFVPPAQQRGTETVLLVEDEDGVRTLSRLVLEKNGYKVIEACNGGEGILLCQQHNGTIDIMVTDVVMPNMSGRTLAEHLAVVRPNMKVLYLSGYTDDAIVRHGVIDPDTPFLQKPFTTDALARKVREVLDADAPS
jgi:PAS domain S-box-containing protein